MQVIENLKEYVKNWNSVPPTIKELMQYDNEQLTDKNYKINYADWNMQTIKIQKLQREFIAHCNNILVKKRKEYGSENNVFEEFKWAAKQLNCTMLDHLRHLLHKHLYSIQKIENEIENGTFKRNTEFLKEKYTDAYNYYIIAIDIIEIQKEYDAEEKIKNTENAAANIVQRYTNAVLLIEKGIKTLPHAW